MEYVRRRRADVNDTFESNREDVLANDGHGFVIARGSTVRNGKRLEWRAHGLYRFEPGLSQSAGYCLRISTTSTPSRADGGREQSAQSFPAESATHATRRDSHFDGNGYSSRLETLPGFGPRRRPLKEGSRPAESVETDGV
jgi:hypothetical protein